MKKTKLLLFLSVWAGGCFMAQENKVWRIGAQFGINANEVKFAGGMPDAHARFEYKPHSTADLNFIARYDYNHRWMGQLGLGFNSIGFEYSIAENYSLFNPKARKNATLTSQFGSLEIPAMLFYKFKPNCKNVRWLVGAGFVAGLTEEQTVLKDFKVNAEGQSTNYLKSESVATGDGYWLFRWSIARERMYRNGSILQASLVFSTGFKELAYSTVRYTIDNNLYEHRFSNNGSNISLRLTWYLWPLKRTGSIRQ